MEVLGKSIAQTPIKFELLISSKILSSSAYPFLQSIFNQTLKEKITQREKSHREISRCAHKYEKKEEEKTPNIFHIAKAEILVTEKLSCWF